MKFGLMDESGLIRPSAGESEFNGRRWRRVVFDALSEEEAKEEAQLFSGDHSNGFHIKTTGSRELN